MNASTVSSKHPEDLLLSIARLAYRLGRQDQQRILERKLYKHYGNGFQAKLLSDLAKGMTDAGVDFLSIVRAAQEHSTAVNSREGECPMNYQVNSGLLPGRMVRVVRPISKMEQDLLGREFEVRRIDKTHGYAVVGDEWGDWHVHPEALDLLGCDHDCPAGCGAQWYGDHDDPCPACGAA